MSHDPRVYLTDIAEATRSAALRQLEVIGEAVKRIPESVRLQEPTVEWLKIAGPRDNLIHEYSDVDLEIIWGVVSSKLGELEHAALRPLQALA